MGLQLVPQKDKYGVRYLTQTLLRPYAKIRYEGKVQMAHQLIYQLVYPDRPRTRLRQMCSSMLCVNPNHWVPFEIYNSVPDDAEPPIEGDWTIEEARALIDTFLANYPGRLIDPDHNLLMDIPPTLLAEVLSRDEYYSGRVLQRDGDRG